MDFFLLKEELKYQARRLIENRIFIFSMIILLFISAIATYFYIDYKNNPKNSFLGGNNFPQVISGNFDIDYKKIPYNIPYIELKFNTKIDPKTVTKDTFTITPKINGNISVIGDSIRYTFASAKLDIGKEIEINATKDIKTLDGESINNYSSFLQIGEAPKVVKISPETKEGDNKTILSNLNRPISVFFNVPMIPLTNTESQDKLPCLIDIEPKIEGTCTWTTTSMLEFIPASPLPGSSLFKIKVSNKDGTLYKLSEEKTSILETSDLAFTINEADNTDGFYTFSASKGLHINANFPVSLDELKKNIILRENSKNMNFSLEQVKSSEQEFILKSTDIKYESDYNISFKKGIKPKFGNLAYKSDKTFKLKTNSFINRIGTYMKQFSSTGSELEATFTSNNLYNLANKNAYLDIYLDEEVDLSNELFNFSFQNGNKVNYSVSYTSEEIIDNKGNKIKKDDKKHLKLEIKDNLPLSSKFKLTISKKTNTALKDDLVYNYNTAAPLKIISLKYISYNKSCIYTNGNLSYTGNSYDKDFKINFSYSPNAKIFSIGEYEANNADKDYNIGKSWEEQVAFNNLSINDKNNKLTLSGMCPMAKGGEVLYVINHRLNPNSSYKFETKKDISDIYGNKITNFFTKNIKTGNDLKEIDKYIYTSISKDVSVIPKKSAIIFKTQTVNLDNITLEACEMDKAGYLDYLVNGYNTGYKPSCIKQVKKDLAVKNKYWDLSYSKFDIENDILGAKSDANFLLIRGYNKDFGNKLENGRNFQNLFIRSDMQAYVEAGGGDPQTGSNRSIIFATDFSGNPILNITTDAYTRVWEGNSSYFKKINITLKYDKDGVYITNTTNLQDAVIFLKSGISEAIITANQDQAGNYDFGYNGGIDSYTKDFLYLYTDRPLYKAGDKVYFKGLARLFSLNGYTKAPYKTGKLELIDESYKTIKSLDVKLDNNSNFSGEFELSKDATIGKYSFRFTVNGQEIINNVSFDIQEYIKPIFKVNLSQDMKDFTLGEETKIKVNPEYYFGGKVISTKGTYSVLSQNYFFDAKEYGDYQFGDGNNYFDCLYWGYCSYGDNLEKVEEFNIDENGNYNLNYKFSPDTKDGEKLYTITAEVEDPDTKKVVSNSITNILHNTDAYLGISLPWWSDKKNGIDFKGVILDYNAKALENKDVKVEIYKREWKSVKKQGVDGNFYNDYAIEDKLENTINIKTGNDGKISKNIKTKLDGEYFIKAIYTGANAKSFTSSREVYVSGDSYMQWNNGNNDITDIVGDKTLIKIGETNDYTLKSPVNSGKALIMIEKDDGVIDYFVHNIKSYADRISIPVKDAYYPNFYVKAFIIGTPANSQLPVYKRALTSTKVVVNSKKINIEIIPNKTSYLPGDKLELTIKVKDISGKPVARANGSIAVVDESLLALMGNPKKNPFAFFYEMKRYLGTLTYISLKNLVEKLEIKDIRDGEKGGAGEQVKGGETTKKRGEFRDTAYWKSDFTTDKNGEFKITTDALPDNLTTWNIESIVTSPDNKIGIAWTSVSTNKKVMVSDNLPAFLGSSDKIRFSPVIFNKTGKDQDFIVSFEGTNMNLNSKEEKVFIKNLEQKTINFEAIVTQNNLLSSISSKINIKAVASDTKDSDEIEKFLEIKNTYTREVVASAGSTSSSKTEKLTLKDIINYPGYLNLNYSTTLLTNLTDSVDYLNSYTYGCSEQKTSSLMPNIFIKKLYNSASIQYNLKEKMIEYYAGDRDGYKKKSLDEIIKNYSVDIMKFQKDSGGFGYWKDLSVGNNAADFVLTSYIVESLSEIRNIGYQVDVAGLDRAKNYLKSRFYKNLRENCVVTKYSDCKYTGIEKLKTVSAIINYDQSDYETYKMYKLIDFKSNNSSSFDLENAKTMVSLYASNKLGLEEKEREALRRTIKSTVNDMIDENLVYSPRGAYISGNESGNRIENTSALVYLMSKAGLENFKTSETIIENILRWMIAQKSDTGFGSTSDNISVIKAFTSYLEKSGELKNVDMKIIAELNGKKIDEQVFNKDNKLISLETNKDFKDMKDNNTLIISKTGSGKAYYDMNLVYYKHPKEIKARNSGFYLETKYFDYNDYKKIEVLKNEEWRTYLSGNINYNKLKYPNKIESYLKGIEKAKVGQLLLVYNKLIVSETRDKVAFEGFIPGGAEIVNPNFATSTAKSKQFAANFFDRTEYRLDRFFAYKGELNVGNYDFIYLIRATSSGSFNLKSSQIYEFYNPEVFGRTSGREFIVE